MVSFRRGGGVSLPRKGLIAERLALRDDFRPITLSDQIYEQVFGLIVSGEFAEGGRLPTELELAERFGVSRSVVREALARLRDDGVVASRQGLGSFVRRRPDQAVLNFAPVGSIADIQRCFEFRAALEAEASSLAAARVTPQSLARIEQALAALEEAVTSNKLGVEGDFAFHFAIAQAAQNRFFESTLATLKSHVEFGMNLARNLSLTRSSERLQAVQNEHVAVLAAIRDGDAPSAREAMRRHIDNARHRVFEGRFQEEPGGTR